MYTEGPWRADNVAEGYIYAGETLIASAQCETLHFKAKGITPAQMNVNAHLIAAAPALLAACEKALKFMADPDPEMTDPAQVNDCAADIETELKTAIKLANAGNKSSPDSSG